MSILLSEISKTIGQAYIYYGIRIVIFTAVALLGMFLGVKIKKFKDAKDAKKAEEPKVANEADK